jgi:methionine sulfoxide reductase heme-binding subunit
MTRAAWVTRVLKPALYVAAVLPLAWLIFALFSGLVMGDQVKFIQHVTGDTVLSCLLLTLTVTPLRRLTGWNEIIRVRRLIGLTAFWYALLHFLSYVVFDQALSLRDIVDDVAEHPWVLVGFASFLMLIPLAVTSTHGWVRRLGGRRWRQLHWLVYLAAIGGVLHYLWLVKKDVTTPVYFAIALGLILALRIWVATERKRVRPKRAPAGVSVPGGRSTFVTRSEDLP